MLQEFGIESAGIGGWSPPGVVLLGRDRQGRVQYLRSEFAVGVVPEGLKVPIQPTLSSVAQHVMQNPRVLRTAPGGPGGNRTHVLLQTPGRGLFTWEEGDWNTPAELAQEIFAQKGEAADRLAAEKHRTGASVPLAIAATDPTPGDSKRAERARVIVYASDFDLMDRNLDLVPIEYRALLVSDNIDWLRDREANLGIPAKKTHTYEIGKGPDLTGLVTLLAIMVVVIGGIGLGVWLARGGDGCFSRVGCRGCRFGPAEIGCLVAFSRGRHYDWVGPGAPSASERGHPRLRVGLAQEGSIGTNPRVSGEGEVIANGREGGYRKKDPTPGPARPGRGARAAGASDGTPAECLALPEEEGRNRSSLRLP